MKIGDPRKYELRLCRGKTVASENRSMPPDQTYHMRFFREPTLFCRVNLGWEIPCRVTRLGRSLAAPDSPLWESPASEEILKI